MFYTRQAQCCEGILRSHVVKLETDLEVGVSPCVDFKLVMENQQVFSYPKIYHDFQDEKTYFR